MCMLLNFYFYELNSELIYICFGDVTFCLLKYWVLHNHSMKKIASNCMVLIKFNGFILTFEPINAVFARKYQPMLFKGDSRIW